MPATDLLEKAARAERWCRYSLGFVWIYEGLVPKIIWVRDLPGQMALMERSGLWFHSPTATLIALGLSQMLLGVALLTGWRARLLAAIATLWMMALIGLVGWNKPDMWIDPFGAFAKDACLLACAVAIWLLHSPRSE